METNLQGLNGYRFYNAGSKIDEQWPFSISPSSAGFNPEDGNGAHSIGKWNFVAPKAAWCFVPMELTSGNEVIRVNFAEDAKRKYGRRGLVMLDPRWDPTKEDSDKALETYPLAPTEQLCIERAERLWDLFLEEICSSHFDDVQNAMAQGNRPRAAHGFTIHALRMKGYRDPAADFLKGMREGQTGVVPQNGNSSEMVGVLRGIQEQNKLMTQLVLALATGQKIDPELLKAVVSPESATAPISKAPTHSAEPPVNAGSMEIEGQPQSSLEARINRRTVEYETAGVRVGGKQDRAKAAAKEL